MSDSTTAQIPTPRTDAKAFYGLGDYTDDCSLVRDATKIVYADFARQLERELAQTTLERNVEANVVTQLSRKVLAMQSYIDYLGEAEAMTVGFLSAHNWRYPAEFIQRGEVLRAAIQAASNL